MLLKGKRMCLASLAKQTIRQPMAARVSVSGKSGQQQSVTTALLRCPFVPWKQRMLPARPVYALSRPGRSINTRQYSNIHRVVSMKSASPQADSAVDEEQMLLSDLYKESRTWSRLALGEGPNGRGMYVQSTTVGSDPPAQERPVEGELYLSIPAEYTLSASLLGSSPEVTEDLALKLLIASDYPWEVKLGGILAVACSPSLDHHKQDSCFGFWKRYRDLMPSSEEQSSILFFSGIELEALQDDKLAETGKAWQRQAEEAYAKCFQCSQPPAISMKELWWGIGTVESRAFSVKLDGQEHAVAVPHLDMVNHQPHALCYHNYSAETNRFELRALDSKLRPGSEAIISYGNKANKRLVEQYGFVIPGNPFDRLSLPELDDLGVLPLARDKLIVALGLDQDYGPRSPEMESLNAQCTRIAEEATGSAADEKGGQRHWRTLWGATEERRIRAVAASLLEKACWRSLSERKRLHCPQEVEEVKTLSALVKWANESLNAFASSVEEDKDILNGAESGSGRLSVAIRYRLERKLLLRTAVRVLSIIEEAYRRS